ncbi:hypothetical protein AX16_006085 [Volvariella volvacea WC 439]|nr:hypothetical protein AX16_006085 [Volvariella volvacea WC 439]
MPYKSVVTPDATDTALSRTIIMRSATFYLVVSTLFAPFAFAHDGYDNNAMEMETTTMDKGNYTLSPASFMYFHFNPPDTLWFRDWVPRSSGAMVGACIGLFLLAVVERFISCMAVVSGQALTNRIIPISQEALVPDTDEGNRVVIPPPPSLRSLMKPKYASPFKLVEEIPHTILHITQLSLHYVLMLAVMTFNLKFVFAITLGQGFGYLLYGRHIITDVYEAVPEAEPLVCHPQEA